MIVEENQNTEETLNKEEQIEFTKILLEMTKYKIGCCFFISENK